MTRPIDPSTLALPVAGHNLAPTTLGDLLDQRTTVLVFLRHHG